MKILTRSLFTGLAVLLVAVVAACGPTAEDDGVKVALVLNHGIDDGGWNQAAYEGLMLAEEEHGVEVDYSEHIEVPDYEGVMRDYANQDYDLIIAHSSIAKDAVMSVAEDFPEINFLWTDGDETQDNVAVVRPMAHENSYLAGMLAGMLTESDIVGMVGGIDIPSTHRSYEAFALGMEEVNEDAELLTTWIGNFHDVAAGNEAATSHIESGADIIFGNGDGQNIGVLQAAQDHGVYAIGAVRDQYEIAPEVTITSVRWGFDTGISMVVEDVLEGEFEGKFYEISLEEGADLAPYHDHEDDLPDEVPERIDETRQQILDGELDVPVIDS